MKSSGIGNSLRIGAVLAVITLGSSACGSGSSKAAPVNGPATSPTTSSATSSSPSATPSPTPSPTPLPAGCHGGIATDLQSTIQILTDPANCPGSVNAYWHTQVGELWTQPVFVAYHDGQLPTSKCAQGSTNPDDFSDNAFYCPEDDTVSYSVELLQSLYASGGPYLPVVVLEHELGHRADHIANTIGPISRSEENQADCDAGVTTAYARTAHRLPLTDVLSAAKELYKLGDTRNFGTELAQSPDAHGTPSQRVIAFGRGYFQKLGECRKIGQSPNGSVA